MVDKKMIYVVGEYIRTTKYGAVWDLAGIFEKQEDAEEACVTDKYFVGPILINEALPTDRQPWPGAYYPKLEVRP